MGSILARNKTQHNQIYLNAAELKCQHSHEVPQGVSLVKAGYDTK